MYDDMAELMEENDMIQEALGRSFATPEDLDESELEAELDALGDEVPERSFFYFVFG
jgi:charged multivesicular body protein 5